MHDLKSQPPTFSGLESLSIMVPMEEGHPNSIYIYITIIYTIPILPYTVYSINYITIIYIIAAIEVSSYAGTNFCCLLPFKFFEDL